MQEKQHPEDTDVEQVGDESGIRREVELSILVKIALNCSFIRDV